MTRHRFRVQAEAYGVTGRHRAPRRALHAIIAVGIAAGVAGPPLTLAAQAVAPRVTAGGALPTATPAEPTARFGGVRVPRFPATATATPSTPSPPPSTTAPADAVETRACRCRPHPSSSAPAPTTASTSPAVPADAPPGPPADPQPAGLDLVALVNRDRAAAGCGPVTVHPDLMAGSQAHAEAQAAADSMYHSGGPAGFGTWGENVAVGYDTAAAVHDAWMGSDGHRANVLNCSFTLIGVGSAVGASGRYWTEQFAAGGS